MFKRKREYFVVWIVDYNGYISYGSHYITSTYRGLKLLNYLISEVQKDQPGAVIISITKID